MIWGCSSANIDKDENNLTNLSLKSPFNEVSSLCYVFPCVSTISGSACSADSVSSEISIAPVLDRQTSSPLLRRIVSMFLQKRERASEGREGCIDQHNLPIAYQQKTNPINTFRV